MVEQVPREQVEAVLHYRHYSNRSRLYCGPPEDRPQQAQQGLQVVAHHDRNPGWQQQEGSVWYNNPPAVQQGQGGWGGGPYAAAAPSQGKGQGSPPPTGQSQKGKGKGKGRW